MPVRAFVRTTAILALAAALGCSPTIDVEQGHPCTDTSADPDNCGACGHGCLGGACVAGVCQVVVLAESAEPIVLAVDHDTVYWADADGGVWKVAKTGGAKVALAPPDQSYPDAIAVDDERVYWVDIPAVLSVLEEGGPVSPVASGLDAATSVVSTGTFVYFTSEGGGLERRALSGGPAAVLWKGDALRVVVVDTDAYVLAGQNQDQGSVVLRLPAEGGEAVTLVSDPDLEGYLGGFACDGHDVYWVSGNPTSLWRIPVSGGAKTKITDDVYDVAVDGSHVYWIDGSALGGIMRAPVAGGAAVALATDQAASSLVVDDVGVYWVNRISSGPGSIRMVAK